MKKIILGILSSLIFATNVLANEVESKKVITTGTGLTETEALKDTTRNAVQQVVGAYILSDTYVKNSQLIKDEILTNSNGYVKGFKIISKTKDSAGIIRIEAEVEVEPNNVTKRLGELNIALKDVATTEFKAISLDKFQASKDFKRMFDEIVLKPIKENKQIYDIKIGELKSVDKLPTYFSLNNNDDLLMPFILSFSVDFKKEYIHSVKSFMSKISIDNDNYDPVKSRKKYVAFGSIYKYDDFELKFRFKSVYELNEGLENSYETLLKDMENYKSTIFINLLDFNKKIIKHYSFSTEPFGYPVMNSIGLSVDKYRIRNDSLFGIDEYSNYGLKLLEYKKNVELGMYLSEDEVSKVKSSSIEIKWEKK